MLSKIMYVQFNIPDTSRTHASKSADEGITAWIASRCTEEGYTLPPVNASFLRRPSMQSRSQAASRHRMNSCASSCHATQHVPSHQGPITAEAAARGACRCYADV